jgi:hypothetical protein
LQWVIGVRSYEEFGRFVKRREEFPNEWVTATTAASVVLKWRGDIS